MLSLYPAIDPFHHYHLCVSNNVLADDPSVDVHHIYVEQCGNPLGIPVVFLHGGPGAGCRPSHRCYFDPQLYHIILFDQRGCGRSRPYGALAENTTSNIIQDMELIRQHIGIEKWLVFGGSWGSTLGLYYAHHFADQVSGLILRGVFLARTQDIDWVYSEKGAAKIFPEAWNNLVEDLPFLQQAQPLSIIYQQLTSDDTKLSDSIFNKLQHWEANLIYWQDLVSFEEASIKEQDKTPTIIQLYYSMHQCFIATESLLDQAWQLKKRWPEAELSIIEMAGHVANEPKIIDALVKATNDFAKRK